MAEDAMTNGEITRTLARIEVSTNRGLDRIEAKLDKSIAEHDRDNDEIGKRVTSLEQWRWFVVGAASVGGASGLWSLFGGG